MCHNRCYNVWMFLLHLYKEHMCIRTERSMIFQLVHSNVILRSCHAGYTEIFDLNILLLNTCALLEFYLSVPVACIPGLYGVRWFLELVLFWCVLIIRAKIRFGKFVEWFDPPCWGITPIDTIDSSDHFHSKFR